MFGFAGWRLSPLPLRSLKRLPWESRIRDRCLPLVLSFSSFHLFKKGPPSSFLFRLSSRATQPPIPVSFFFLSSFRRVTKVRARRWRWRQKPLWMETAGERRVRSFPLHPNRITGKCELGSGKGKGKREKGERGAAREKWGRRAKGPHFRGGGGGGGDACGKFRAAVK